MSSDVIPVLFDNANGYLYTPTKVSKVVSAAATLDIAVDALRQAAPPTSVKCAIVPCKDFQFRVDAVAALKKVGYDVESVDAYSVVLSQYIFNLPLNSIFSVVYVLYGLAPDLPLSDCCVCVIKKVGTAWKVIEFFPHQKLTAELVATKYPFGSDVVIDNDTSESVRAEIMKMFPFRNLHLSPMMPPSKFHVVDRYIRSRINGDNLDGYKVLPFCRFNLVIKYGNTAEEVKLVGRDIPFSVSRENEVGNVDAVEVYVDTPDRPLIASFNFGNTTSRTVSITISVDKTLVPNVVIQSVMKKPPVAVVSPPVIPKVFATERVEHVFKIANTITAAQSVPPSVVPKKPELSTVPVVPLPSAVLPKVFPTQTAQLYRFGSTTQAPPQMPIFNAPEPPLMSESEKFKAKRNNPTIPKLQSVPQTVVAKKPAAPVPQVKPVTPLFQPASKTVATSPRLNPTIPLPPTVVTKKPAAVSALPRTKTTDESYPHTYTHIVEKRLPVKVAPSLSQAALQQTPSKAIATQTVQPCRVDSGPKPVPTLSTVSRQHEDVKAAPSPPQTVSNDKVAAQNTVANVPSKVTRKSMATQTYCTCDHASTVTQPPKPVSPTASTIPPLKAKSVVCTIEDHPYIRGLSLCEYFLDHTYHETTFLTISNVITHMKKNIPPSLVGAIIYLYQTPALRPLDDFRKACREAGYCEVRFMPSASLWISTMFQLAGFNMREGQKGVAVTSGKEFYLVQRIENRLQILTEGSVNAKDFYHVKGIVVLNTDNAVTETDLKNIRKMFDAPKLHVVTDDDKWHRCRTDHIRSFVDSTTTVGDYFCNDYGYFDFCIQIKGVDELVKTRYLTIPFTLKYQKAVTDTEVLVYLRRGIEKMELLKTFTVSSNVRTVEFILDVKTPIDIEVDMDVISEFKAGKFPPEKPRIDIQTKLKRMIQSRNGSISDVDKLKTVKAAQPINPPVYCQDAGISVEPTTTLADDTSQLKAENAPSTTEDNVKFKKSRSQRRKLARLNAEKSGKFDESTKATFPDGDVEKIGSIGTLSEGVSQLELNAPPKTILTFTSDNHVLIKADESYTGDEELLAYVRLEAGKPPVVGQLAFDALKTHSESVFCDITRLLPTDFDPDHPDPSWSFKTTRDADGNVIICGGGNVVTIPVALFGLVVRSTLLYVAEHMEHAVDSVEIRMPSGTFISVADLDGISERIGTKLVVVYE